MKPRLLVLAPDTLFRSFFDAVRQRRLSRSFAWSVRSDRSLTPGLRRALVGAEALVTTWDSPRFDGGLLRQAPRLRVIGHCGGEVKGRFAPQLLARLTVTHAPAPMARPVAELAVAFLLHAARNVDAYRRALARPSNAIYGRLHLHGAGAETVRGRAVGLLGFGQVGRAVAELLRPFGARLLVHDPHVSAAVIRRLGGTVSSWRELLDAPYLILAAALTDETRGVLDARALARLPEGATVINVGRGGLVDLAALTREVRAGRLRCALDVTDPQEPLPVRHPLRRAAGAVLTPHVGAAHREVRGQIADMVLGDLERFFRGARVRHRVTVSMLERMT